ncbi:unnamed protein product [Parnassius apollo]|uniref:(apollo) hypothetical protein n=1 Tax=Parnassius apollo TaxID=110799 RepID=A0A8S3XE04_PARAO|nr:unnamed protein product [Parnassius apollo]
MNILTSQLHDLKSIKTLEEISGKPELLPEPDNVVMQTMQKANELTPLTKTNIFINEELPQISESSKAKVKQKLLQHHVMEDSLKETYRGTKKFKERRVLKNIINSKAAIKYNLKTKMTKYLGLKCEEEGFTEGTWSFFETSHGKGAADGVGGVEKRTLDARVAYGVDIVDAESVFDILSKTVTSVKTFYVPESNIEMIQIPEPERVTPIPSTMKVHQVIATEYENIIKKNRCKNSRKNQDSSTENTDMEIEYAESDTSEWNENESFVISSSEENAQNIPTESESKIQENQKKKTRDKEIVKNNGKNQEELKKSIFKGHCGKMKENKKVAVLADVKITPKNLKNLDLKSYGKITLNEIGLDFDVYSKKLPDKSSTNSVPSTSKTDLLSPSKRSSTLKENMEHQIDTCNAKDSKTVDQQKDGYSGICDFTEKIEVDNAVLVRYFMRKWKYYIGFVTSVEIKDGTTFYTVSFLKTVKTPKI